MKNAAEPCSLIIKRIHKEARDIRAFDMMPEAADAQDTHDARLSFVPGQVAMLKVAGEDPSYFAFASAPDDEELEFLIKRNAVGSGRLIYDMNEGERVELVGIVGHGFALDKHKGKDLVFVAMGTGVAPLRSALRHALKQPDDHFSQIVVLYGARTPDDFCYTDEVDAWKAAGVDIRQVISKPDGYEWSGSTGYVQSLLDNVLPNLSNPIALICGSRLMIEQTRDRLQEMGFAPEDILTNF
ncbi:MAG TPA: hypothetical protein VF666_20105 [Pyrinomonadaceae bacterium]|jgi:NAD(P)H-flavin reductase